LRLIDDRIALDDLECQGGIVGGQRPARLPDGRLDECAHPQDRVPDERLVPIQCLARGLGEDPPWLVRRVVHEPLDLGIHGGLRTRLLVSHRQPNRPDT
jgi:hypothetical protein